MIHWKNKPISQLSKAELQEAIFDLAEMATRDKQFVVTSNPFMPFALGTIVGGMLSLLGLVVVFQF